MKKSEIVEVTKKLSEGKQAFFVIAVDTDELSATFAVGGKQEDLIALFNEVLNIRPDVEGLIKYVLVDRANQNLELGAIAAREKAKGNIN